MAKVHSVADKDTPLFCKFSAKITRVFMTCISLNGYLFKQCYYGLNLLNIVITAIYLYFIDLTVEDDPKVKNYGWMRWHLLTIWFNGLFLFYIPFCMYYDWREKNGDATPRMDQLRQLRDLLMTTILFPITVYCDSVFWLLYIYFPWIIGPARMLEAVPLWCQHTFHTFSLLFVVVDLVLTPRQRPDSDKKNITVLYGFSLFYCLDMYVNYKFGYMLYAFLYTASRTVCLLSAIGSFFIVTISYYAQWHIVGYIWGHKTVKTTKSAKFLK